MKKIKKIFQYALPITSTLVISAGVATPMCIAVNNLHQQVLANSLSSANSGVVISATNTNPKITDDFAQDFLFPVYDDDVISTFGVPVKYYNSDGNYITTITWPRLVSNQVNNASTTISSSDLIDFSELFPSDALASRLAQIVHASTTSSVAVLDSNTSTVTSTLLQNYSGSDLFLTGVFSDVDSSTDIVTGGGPIQNLDSLFLNPFIYDLNADCTWANGIYSEVDSDYELDTSAVSYGRAFSSVSNISIDYNNLSTLPEGIFYQFNGSGQLAEVDISDNDIAVFNPSTLFAPNSLISDFALAANDTYLSEDNFGGLIDSNIGTSSYWDGTGASDSTIVETENSSSTGITVDDETLTDIITTALTNTDTVNNINDWPTNIVDISDFDSIVWSYITSLGLITGTVSDGLEYFNVTVNDSIANNFKGTINISASVDGWDSSDEPSYTITGFKEATSGIIVDVILLFSFILVLYFASKKIYKRTHLSLTKAEKKKLKNKK